ncbi:hypothetical protein [Microbacterium testaceum]|uniref:hypothetical protein n=1 Tax=Microbacterium testaceum TaxID=2033 RepID=UPI0011AF3B60|nr:hypothetical protein [Microbacterium testaceum]
MDETKRSTPRRYPPFGEIPAALEGSPELRLELESTTASLTGFVCSPNGLSATLRTAARVVEGGSVTYGFAAREHVDDAVHIWATSLGSGAQSEERLYAHLLSGGGGTEGTLHAAMFQLWIPIDVAALTADVTIEMAWPTADTTVQVIISAASLRHAAARADLRFIGH